MRPLSPDCLEEILFYGDAEGLTVYGGVYYPGARSSMANTGGSRRLDCRALLADPAAALRAEEHVAWTLLREEERAVVLDWAQRHA